MILIYVDDHLITRNNFTLIKDSKVHLQQKFKIKDLGELKYFLGIKFVRSKKGILMTLRKYTLELSSKWGLASAKPAMTPLEQHMKFTSVEFEKHLRKGEREDPQLVDLSKVGRKVALLGTDYARNFLCSTNLELIYA